MAAAIAVPNRDFGDLARSAAAPNECISFAIDDEQYGVDIMAVREIKRDSDQKPA